MDRKAIMGLAAVAGIGLLLYLRRGSDSSAIASTGGAVGNGAGLSGLWGATGPIVISNPLARAPVADTSAANKAPAPAAAPPAAGSGSASRFVSGPSGSDKGAGSEFYYRTMGPNGMIQGSVEAARNAELREVRDWVQGYNVNDPSQVQAMFDAAKSTGRSYDDTVRDLAASTGYMDNDVGKVASGAGVARW